MTGAKYQGRGGCTVKGSGSKGCVSRRLLSGKFLPLYSSDCLGTFYRENEGCGGSAAWNHARAADFGRKAEEQAVAAVATSVATAAKGLAIGSWAERAPFLRVLQGKESAPFLRVF